MNAFIITYSERAKKDLDNLFVTITVDYKAPITAYRYIQGIIDTIKMISKSPESFSIAMQKSLLLRYGFNVRRVNYKKMAIIYTIHNNVVYIHRIIANSMIINL